MKVREITEAIEEFAPLGIQEPWDNSGLCIGSPEDEVRGVLVGFDCTPELIREAVERGCSLVVTHHPLIFKGLKRIDPADPVGLAVILAIRNGVAVYAAHTTADKVLEGVSGAMAARLGLGDVTVLDPGGLGALGTLPEPLSGEEAVAYVKGRMGLSALRCSDPSGITVRTVAVCGGSGGGLIGTARECGADLYVSADISYHNFFTPRGFMIMDIGHFESEVEIVDLLIEAIRKKISNFALLKSNRLGVANPVHYL